MKAFLLVAMKENLSSNEYARMAGVGSAQMSHRIGCLGELRSNLQPGYGLAESRPDPLDRRLTLVRLTDKGRALAGQLARAVEFGSRTMR
jgi:DNA-binding MarR family transcriptional regulator